MHLSGSSYRPALLSVEGMSGRGCLPVGVSSASLSTEEETEPRLARAEGDAPEPSRRRALQQVEPSSRTPHGPPVPAPVFP